MENPQEVLNGGICAMFLLNFLFFLCAIDVIGSANIGFNTLLIAFIYFGYSILSYLTINKLKSPLSFGITLGFGIYVCVLALMTSIYWGQLSLCERPSDTIYSLIDSHYSCDIKVAYRGVCLMSIVLFFAQLIFTGLLSYFQDHILKDISEYAPIRDYSLEDEIEQQAHEQHVPVTATATVHADEAETETGTVESASNNNNKLLSVDL